MKSEKHIPADKIRDLLQQVSSHPGVYIMKSADKRVLYVGKAANLRKRLSSYFTKSEHADPKTRVLVQKIASFEVVITGSEKEALILEANLIKRHKPRYNIVLKDDKRYPLLRLNMNHAYPNLRIVRRIKKDGAKYFGPYASAGAVRQTMRIVNRTFRLRKCKDKEFKLRRRPCLHFQMKSCLAPCCETVDPSYYGRLVDEVVLFLNGRTPDLIRHLKENMKDEARKQHFEMAAVLRDKIFALEKTLEKQVIVTADLKDRDVVALADRNGAVVITLLFVRGGFILGSRHFEFANTLAGRTDIMESFLRQYYEKAHVIPTEILVSTAMENHPLIEAHLKSLKKGRVIVRQPKRGEKKRLLLLAKSNAENRLTAFIESAAGEKDLLTRLQRRLRLKHLPDRIECFDNSSIQGASPVSGMVVFEGGQAAKQFYRTYKIKTDALNDDYASMAEVLNRRFNSLKSQDPFPDLLMVDGGKGQLNIAMAVLDELGLQKAFDVIGIAKKDESRGESTDKIYKPGRMNPVALNRDYDLLLYLQKIRDEAHRFAISFHRKQRGRVFIRSELDRIQGVGEKRKAALLKHFGSVQGIRAASLKQIASVSGMNTTVARAVKEGLAKE